MRKAGIIGAMEEEVAPLKESAKIHRILNRAGMQFFEGFIGKQEVVIVQSGMGKVNAGICAQILVDEFHVSHVINTGLAGSLTDELHTGDIVISTEALQHDYDVSPIGFAKGEVPYTGLIAFPADEALKNRAYEAANVRGKDHVVLKGRVCSGDQFISSDAERNRIVSEFQGVCCEMEGAAIAQVCHLNRVPYVIIRVISDSADDNGGAAFEEFLEETAVFSSEIVRSLLLWEE